MTAAIMAMPRTGSAWLAAYFGYLHDPLLTRTWEEVQAYSIVDTGAAYNPEAVYAKYRAAGKRIVVILRSSSGVYDSLRMTARFPQVTRTHVCRWLDDMAAVAERHDIPTLWYEDLMLGRFSEMHAEELCEYLLEDFDRIRWGNQLGVKVEAMLDAYTPEAFQRYKEWVDAPQVR